MSYRFWTNHWSGDEHPLVAQVGDLIIMVIRANSTVAGEAGFDFAGTGWAVEGVFNDPLLDAGKDFVYVLSRVADGMPPASYLIPTTAYAEPLSLSFPVVQYAFVVVSAVSGVADVVASISKGGAGDALPAVTAPAGGGVGVMVGILGALSSLDSPPEPEMEYMGEVYWSSPPYSQAVVRVWAEADVEAGSYSRDFGSVFGETTRVLLVAA